MSVIENVKVLMDFFSSFYFYIVRFIGLKKDVICRKALAFLYPQIFNNKFTTSASQSCSHSPFLFPGIFSG